MGNRYADLPVKPLAQALEEQGYKRFAIRDRETGEVVYECWAKTRRNAVRQARYHRNKNKKQGGDL